MGNAWADASGKGRWKNLQLPELLQPAAIFLFSRETQAVWDYCNILSLFGLILKVMNLIKKSVVAALIKEKYFILLHVGLWMKVYSIFRY